jgi:ribulose-5-phosphate 4-epimerase/fuculose-1-phosphate aldolase
MKIGDIEYQSLRGKVPDAEWRARVDLAAIYRLYGVLGWWDLLQAPASARVPGEPHYLFAPAACLWEEVTASSLVKIDVKAKKVVNSPFEIIEDNWYPFRAVHEVREDANFVIHTHDIYGMALSARPEGLLAVTQNAALVFGSDVRTHDYPGVETHESTMAGLQASLNTGGILILNHHGFVTLGRVAFEAVARTYLVRTACQAQLLAGKGADLRQLEPKIVAGFKHEIERSYAYPSIWPALLRKLDRVDPSYKE